jgi:hypothetical protein
VQYITYGILRGLKYLHSAGAFCVQGVREHAGQPPNVSGPPSAHT